MQADIVTQLILPLSMFVIMLGMGLTLSVADFRRVLAIPRGAAVGIAGQMLLLPLLGLAVIAITGLRAELAVGLMVLAFCPGGTTSNMYCFLARGDLALSITLTAIVSVITPFSIPALSQLTIAEFLGADTEFRVPVLSTIAQLLVITIVPVSIGMFIHHRAPAFARRVENPVKIFSVVFFLLIILLIIIGNRDAMVGYFLEVGIACLLLNAAAMVAGYLLAAAARLDVAQRTTVSFEVGIQNSAMALLVTGTLLNSPAMSVPAVVYGLLMFFSGGAGVWLFLRLQRRHAPAPA